MTVNTPNSGQSISPSVLSVVFELSVGSVFTCISNKGMVNSNAVFCCHFSVHNASFENHLNYSVVIYLSSTSAMGLPMCYCLAEK